MVTHLFIFLMIVVTVWETNSFSPSLPPNAADKIPESEWAGITNYLLSCDLFKYSISPLGTDGRAGLSTWSPFQNAASGVTSLYKECIESQRRFANIGYNCGVHRRNKELVNWLKKRKRCIRREELLAFLSGKASANSSGHHHHHPSHSHLRAWSSSRQRVGIADNGSHAGTGGRSPFGGVTLTRLTLSDSPSRQANEEDLETFREALSKSFT